MHNYPTKSTAAIEPLVYMVYLIFPFQFKVSFLFEMMVIALIGPIAKQRSIVLTSLPLEITYKLDLGFSHQK